MIVGMQTPEVVNGKSAILCDWWGWHVWLSLVSDKLEANAKTENMEVIDKYLTILG